MRLYTYIYIHTNDAHTSNIYICIYIYIYVGFMHIGMFIFVYICICMFISISVYLHRFMCMCGSMSCAYRVAVLIWCAGRRGSRVCGRVALVRVFRWHPLLLGGARAASPFPVHGVQRSLLDGCRVPARGRCWRIKLRWSRGRT